jgi:hypothetical protein
VIRNEAGEEVCEVLLEVDKIHKAILERNKNHFHQADETPFAGGAENTVLYDLLGYTGMSKVAKDVVEGTFLEKYGDKLGDILPETEQVICEWARGDQGTQKDNQLQNLGRGFHLWIQGLERKRVYLSTRPTSGTLQGHCN